MLKKILVVLVVIIGIFAIVVATRPSSFKIERSAVIVAPPDVIYSQINDLHAWSSWSPWEKQDPAMKKTFSGAPAGVGSVYEWASDNVGQGRMTITECHPNDHTG